MSPNGILKIRSTLEHSLRLLEQEAISNSTGKSLRGDIVEVLETGWKLLGDNAYKAPDPSNECQVCEANLDELQIICAQCFDEAFDYDPEDIEDLVPDRYKRKRYLQFVANMMVNNLPVVHYKGGFGYEGPAVYTCDEITPFKVYKASPVDCHVENNGNDFIVFPK